MIAASRPGLFPHGAHRPGGACARRAPRAALLAAITIAAGCAVGPDFHRPRPPANAGYAPKPLPEQTSAPSGVGGGAERFAMGADVPFRWWEAFGSAELDALVEQAFRQNPSIKAAQAALRQAQELKYAQEGAFYPSVTADYNFERQKMPGNTATTSAPGVQGNGQVIQPPGPAQPVTFNFQTAQLEVGFVPDVFGANRRKVESLDAQAQMQRFELEATYLTLAANVVGAAITEGSVRGQIDATRAIIAHNEKALAIIKDKFDHGWATRIDLAGQESALAQAQALLPPLEKQLEQNRDLLRALVGNLPNQDVELHLELKQLKLPADLPVSLPAKIIEQRPDVRAAEEQLRSANAQVGVAIAAMLPQFNITGTVGGVASQFSWMFRKGGPFWSAIGDASQPLFQGGTLLHQKRAAEQALKQAAAQYQSTVLQAYQNVADSLHAVISDTDALGAAIAAERAAKVTLDLTDQRMQQGYSDYLTELAAAMAYQQAVVSLAQAQGARFSDVAALYQALGGGWWNRAAGSATASADAADAADAPTGPSAAGGARALAAR